VANTPREPGDGDDDSSAESKSSTPGGRKKRQRVAVVVALPVKRELSERHRDELLACGLTEETIALACLYTETHGARLGALVARKWGNWGTAIVFMFYEPGATEPYGCRVKADRPRRKGTKKNGKPIIVKYDQADDTGVYVYFPPRARLRNAYMPAEGEPLDLVVWVEGEKKSLACDQLGFVCVGLTGVWMWGAGDTEREGDRLNDLILKHVKIAGRAHVICFDADARSNSNVMLAAQRFAGLLLANGATSVTFICPPLVEGGPKGVDDYLAAHGAEATRALIASAGVIEPLDPKQPLQRVRSVLRDDDAPIDAGALVPPGYEIQRDGSLWAAAKSEKKGDELVSHVPMFITRKLVDVYTGDERVELAFAAKIGESKVWRTISASRRAIGEARTMVAELAPLGAPVTSNSASKIVDWLEAYERVNTHAYERVACVSRFGWHTVGGSSPVFVGAVTYSSDGDADESPGANASSITLDARGDRRKVVDAMKPRGTLEGHLIALRKAWAADSVCAVAICAAFAATLLEPLRAPNFAVHLPGESSRGKTSMLKIAASVFGDPESAQVVASWNVTNVGAEIRAAQLCDLPQCYDEVGGGDPQAIERLVYSLINGGGRTRAQRDLTLRETSSWRTILLSTGERALADEMAATGAQVRIVTLPVAGFGKLTGAEIDELREACAANAGQAGDAWLRRIVEQDADDWEESRAVTREIHGDLRARSPKDSLQGRVAGYFALLVSTETMLAEAFQLGEENGATMHAAFDALTQSEPVQGIAERARDMVGDRILQEPEAFPELDAATDEGSEIEPKRTGKTRYGFVKGDRVFLIPGAFRKLCADNRLTAREVLREWKRLGWLVHDRGRFDKTVRVGAQTPHLYLLIAPSTGQQTTVKP
jgi:hypothetical protein